MKKIFALLIAAAVLFGLFEIYKNSDYYNNEELFASDSAVVIENDNCRIETAESYNKILYNYEEVIEKLKEGYENQDATINLRSFKITAAELADITAYLASNCGCYYLDNHYSYSVLGDYVVSVSQNYVMSVQEVERYNKEIDTVIEAVAKKAASLNTTVEKLLYIHNYLVDTIEYDDKSSDSYNNVYGALVLKKTMCLGYSEAFRYIAEKAGIKTYMVLSDKLNHAWNMVNISGKYYFIDCTWDDPVFEEKNLTTDPVSGYGSYRYFMCSEDYFLKNTHNSDDWTVNGEDIMGAASNIEYDDFFWRDYESLMKYADKNWFYGYGYDDSGVKSKKDVEFSIDKITFLSNSRYDKRIVRTINACWSMGGMYYTTFDPTLQCLNDNMYYFKSDGIYRLEPDGRFNGKDDLLIFENTTDKNIYDFDIDADEGIFTVVFGGTDEFSDKNAVIKTYNISEYFM